MLRSAYSSYGKWNMWEIIILLSFRSANTDSYAHKTRDDQEELTQSSNSKPLGVAANVLTMCYLIERNTTGTTYDYNRAAASLDLAKHYANEAILSPDLILRSVYREVAQTSPVTHIVATAYGLRDDGIECDVYIGPGSGRAAEVLYDLVSVWNIPIIGCPAAGVGQSAPASTYDIISRVSYTYVGITSTLLRLFDTYNYTTPVLFQDQSVSFFQQFGALMQDTIIASSEQLRYGANFVPFDSSSDDIDYIKSQMITASYNSRVYAICAAGTIVRQFMVWANELGMTDGDYVFITFEPYRSDVWGTFSWRRNDSSDSAARQAYHALLILSFNNDVSNSAVEFSREVVKLSRLKYNYTFAKTQLQAHTDPLVAHFYDAVLLYANLVKSMKERGLNYRSGLAFTQAVAHYSFESPVTGTVRFNADSDRILEYAFRMFNERNGKLEAVLGYPSSNRPVQLLGPFNWFGRSTLPPNTPFCGFRGENPACATLRMRFSNAARVGVAIAGLGLLAGLCSAISYAVKRRVRKDFDPSWWRVHEHEIRVPGGFLDTNKTGERHNSISGPHSDSTTSCRGLMGTMNGTPVGLLELPKPNHHAGPAISRITLPLRTLHHNNLQKFTGITISQENLCTYVVGEQCCRGTLQDVIADSRLELDWEFKSAMLKDLINGIVYLHASVIESHGFLSDTACLLCSQFILKIGGYGLGSLHSPHDLEAFHPSQVDQRDIQMLLWRAPELLRRAMPPAGTQKGDVYSFAILMQQIILRANPYERPHHDALGKRKTVNAEDIIVEVCRGATPYVRPSVPPSACPQPIHDLMASCWEDNPEMRPNSSKIRLAVLRAVGESGDSIVSHLIKRMEVYANELEAQATLKTQEFMEEKQRSDMILKEILPSAVAEALAQGRQVLPVTYPSTTVYFGSVPGFKDATMDVEGPLQTVKMLNDLYNVCDTVMAGLDVFKVEVLLDDYLVVSGLPVENGLRHVEHIAIMALQLRKAISTLKKDTGAAFQIRVGIHSGPCVAGVVGRRMPRYCLFGDTINTASRMESHGEVTTWVGSVIYQTEKKNTGNPCIVGWDPVRYRRAGKIHVSETAKNLLDITNGFFLEKRGIIFIKGKGNMTTYFLRDQKQ